MQNEARLFLCLKTIFPPEEYIQINFCMESSINKYRVELEIGLIKYHFMCAWCIYSFYSKAKKSLTIDLLNSFHTFFFNIIKWLLTRWNFTICILIHFKVSDSCWIYSIEHKFIHLLSWNILPNIKILHFFEETWIWFSWNIPERQEIYLYFSLLFPCQFLLISVEKFCSFVRIYLINNTRHRGVQTFSIFVNESWIEKLLSSISNITVNNT